MTPDQALSQLRSIHLPPTPLPESTLPLWLLPVIAMVVAIIGCLWWRNRRRQVWLMQARTELRSIASDAANGLAARGWQRLAVLMRQIVLLHGDPVRAAAATGDQWLALLDETLQTSLFLEGPGRALNELPYRKPDEPPVNETQLGMLCQQLLPLIEALARRTDSATGKRAHGPLHGSKAQTP